MVCPEQLNSFSLDLTLVFSNELNAAYAADGYSRVKGVPGCLSTTFVQKVLLCVC